MERKNNNFFLLLILIALLSSCASGGGGTSGVNNNSNNSGGTNTNGTTTNGSSTNDTNTVGGGGGVFNSPVEQPDLNNDFDFTVREVSGIARVNEVVRSGMPLARSLGITSVNSLAVVDSNNQPVAAEFRILARWDAALSQTSAPIQWVLVVFPANVSANSVAVYRLVTDGSVTNPAPQNPLQLTQNGNQITVNTGAAIFRLGANPANLFDSIALGTGTQLSNGGALSGRVGVNGSPTTFTNTNHTSTARRIYIEHQGPLSAVVVMEGVYDHAQVGGGGIGSVRRYVFAAGSPTAIVRHAVKWEGTLCDFSTLECGNVNGLRIGGMQDLIDTSGITGARTVAVLGARNTNLVTSSVPANATASIRQTLRNTRTDARLYRLNVPSIGEQTGVSADGGMLSLAGTNGSISIALNRMHRYEPQALRLNSNGSLAVEMVDTQGGQVWLGNHQGMFATLAVSVSANTPDRASLDQNVWAPLNTPLSAWPNPAWFRNSQAVDEFPVGTLPASVASYDTFIPSLLNNTLNQVDARGLNGMMTYGVYVREWGNDENGYNEINCGANDNPTPGETWDDLYWCGFWTDYHNNSLTAAIWAMRSGQTEWLDEISKPAAMRTLYTQIMQCAPTDTGFFYCGQAPAGYRGYRTDNNASHGYFDNLFLYYWLSGDSTVPNTILQGADNMRNYLCTTRNSGAGAACGATVPKLDYFANLTGRAAMQWVNAFRFIGLSANGSYLDDYKSILARAATLNYLQVNRNNQIYGFWLGGDVTFNGNTLYNYLPAGSINQVDANRRGSSDQLWLATLYDFNMLYRLQLDTNDAPIGSPAVRPSDIIHAWANTLAEYGSNASGDGSAAGQWPNALQFEYSGNRIGGTLVNAAADTGGGDPYLYGEGKACLASTLLRTQDQSLMPLGEDLTLFGLNVAENSVRVLDKSMGINLARLHAAIAHVIE